MLGVDISPRAVIGECNRAGTHSTAVQAGARAMNLPGLITTSAKSPVTVVVVVVEW